MELHVRVIRALLQGDAVEAEREMLDLVEGVIGAMQSVTAR